MDVHERSGALQNAIDLIQSAHSQGMKIVIDFPIAATSIQHEWFRRSSRASLQENADFATYYFWKRNLQPSEFVSYFNETENLYYHVEDHPEWPVLNYGAPNVTREIKVTYFEYDI
jgi:glycosidase